MIRVIPRITNNIYVQVETSRVISCRPSLHREIAAKVSLEGLAAVTPKLTGDIETDASLITEIRRTSGDVEYYDGEYEATPKTETSTQIFPTQDKMMRRNFLVYTIPTREEYNLSGGVTFTIGD